MSSLFFVIPAYRRLELTKLCLRRLTVTIAELAEYDVEAQAVVIADDENLVTAHELGFWAIEQANEPLGRKFNDGIELAAREGAEYVMPFGTDNWIDARVAAVLPLPNTVTCRRQIAVVREDGLELAYCNVDYTGGDGIRTFPIAMFKAMDYRPAADFAKRAVDTSIVDRLKRFTGWSRAYHYHDFHALQIVSFQSHDVQLNTYEGLNKQFNKDKHFTDRPWTELDTVYDRRSVDEVREHYLGVPA